MKILVTGGNGFIGRHVVAELEKRPDFSVLAPTRQELDVEYEDAVGRYLRDARPDAIFHLAGDPNVRLRPEDACGFHQWRTNVHGTFHLLAHAPAGCRFVLASSASVYGDMGVLGPCRENAPVFPTSVYAASKAAAEALLNAYHARGLVRGLALRFVANVGPGATHGVVLDLFNKLHSPLQHLRVLGTPPGSSKPYAHVLDTAAAAAALGLSRLTGTINVGPADAMTSAEVAATLMDACGVRKPVIWAGEGANWPGDNRTVRVSNGILRQLRVPFLYETSKEAVYAAAKEMMACRTPSS